MTVNHFDIYKLLPKTNCGYCQARTCMAFSLDVIRGSKQVKDCPYVNPEAARSAQEQIPKREDWRDGFEQRLTPLRDRISKLDLDAVAQDLGGVVVNGKLKIPVLGRPFFIRSDGRIESEVHINPWVSLPLLNYVIRGGKGPVSGHWISFDDLSSGTIRAQYFRERSQEPLRKLFDRHLPFVDEVMALFSTETLDSLDSDCSWKMYPFPKIPWLLMYWKPEAPHASRLNLLLDQTVERFLDAESVFTLARGFTEMLERLVTRHAEPERT